MRGGMKTLKHNVRNTLQLAYHGCKNLDTHEQNASRKTHPNGCNCEVHDSRNFTSQVQ